jgi:hypothetical protein
MLQPRKLHLSLPFLTLGSPCKNLKNEFGSVKHGQVPEPVQVSLMHRRKRLIKNHFGDRFIRNHCCNLFSLAASYE